MNQRNPKRPQPNVEIGDDEWRRLHKLTAFERKARQKGYHNIAGVDEAGRGPLAGPVYAAACVIPKNVFISGVDDSKKLTPRVRSQLYDALTQHPQIHYAIGSVSSEDIDRINILQATILAMKEAVANLPCEPDYLLVDGLTLSHSTISCEKIIGGDSKSYSIAAASIIAKESRDRVMRKYHEKWPQYGFAQHKGYGTRAHREAIHKYGPCPIHRFTFEPIKSMILFEH